MSRYGARANSKRNRTKSKKDNSKRDDYLRTQKEDIVNDAVKHGVNVWVKQASK